MFFYTICFCCCDNQPDKVSVRVYLSFFYEYIVFSRFKQLQSMYSVFIGGWRSRRYRNTLSSCCKLQNNIQIEFSQNHRHIFKELLPNVATHAACSRWTWIKRSIRLHLRENWQALNSLTHRHCFKHSQSNCFFKHSNSNFVTIVVWTRRFWPSFK